MQRVWATGGEADRGPMEWIGAIRAETVVADHIRLALAAASTPDATLEQCLTGMLAIESVTYIAGGDADLHPMLHQWMHDLNPRADEALRTAALALLAALQAESALARHWRGADGEAGWRDALDNARARLTSAKRKPDPLVDPRIVALARSFTAAKDHLRVALVPYELDEPIVQTLVAPGLSIVLHYADVGELDPIAVPTEHARAWNKSAKAIAKLAAKRTREVSDLRTHILENQGFEVNVAFGNSAFTAGLLASADLLLLEGKAPYGILVAAPNSGTVVWHRIADATWREAAVEVIKQANEIFANSSHTISTQLWWWFEGKVIELPYTVVAGTFIIQPVEAFAACVKAISS